MSKANKRWHGIAPGMAFAITIYAEDKLQAKRSLRNHLGVTRLPKGSAIWATPK